MGLVFQATHSMAQAMVVVLCCYLVVAVFAVKGSELAPRAG
jgi:fucose permease